jgi:hypothetical protein
LRSSLENLNHVLKSTIAKAECSRIPQPSVRRPEPGPIIITAEPLGLNVDEKAAKEEAADGGDDLAGGGVYADDFEGGGDEDVVVVAPSEAEAKEEEEGVEGTAEEVAALKEQLREAEAQIARLRDAFDSRSAPLWEGKVASPSLANEGEGGAGHAAEASSAGDGPPVEERPISGGVRGGGGVAWR